MKKNFYKIVLVLFTLSLFTGCRTMDKAWLRENYTSKIEADSLRQSLENSFKSVQKTQKEEIEAKYKEFQRNTSEKTNSSEAESTTVKGRITAEAGIEKSVTVGGTTIKSNGADIDFETTNNKESSKESELRFEQMSRELEIKTQKIETLEERQHSLEVELYNFKKLYEAEKNIKEKDVKTKGSTLGTVVIGLLILLAVGVSYYFRKTVFGWFEKIGARI